LRTRQARTGLARKYTAALAIGLFALAACGADKPSQEALKSKLKQDSTFSGYKDAQVDCVASALLKYANGGDLSDYVNGKKGLTDIRSPDKDNKVLTDDISNCVKAAG
jgi:hypothetical protein